MASSLSLLLFTFLLATTTAANCDETVEMVMEKSELSGLFEFLGSLLDDPNWSQVHPSPCTETPWPGVQCEVSDEDPSIFHVTKIHIGPDIISPPCKSGATLPESLLELKYLKTLSLFQCFTAATHPVSLSPSLFGHFSSLEHLSIVSNPGLVGTIPATLTEAVSLRVLSFSQNSLQGEIPTGFGGLVNLEQLDLSYNNFSGEINEEVGGLKHLTILDLSNNGFEGMVPYTLGHLDYLQKIDLSNNKFVAKVPQQLGSLNKLVLLDLSGNFITGPLPETLSGLKQLEYLIIENCPINTRMPLFIGTLEKLTTLSLSKCGLIGEIPDYFPSLKTLTSLSLSNNALKGTVPSNIGTLVHLDQLNLSQNQLSGELNLQQDFITRLGKRLDVTGNIGLCSNVRSNFVDDHRDLDDDHHVHSCLGGTKCCNNKTQDQPGGSQRVRPPDWYHEKMSSNCSSINCNQILFILTTFVVWFFKILEPFQKRVK